MVPTVDPSYVYDLLWKKVVVTMESAVEHLFKHTYPKIKDRVRFEYAEQRRKAYLGEDGNEFNINEFLTVYPDPEAFFEHERKTNQSYEMHAIVC
ncbi:unnamed protein product [Gongylonema pulchrum]|uniref:CRAL-TRIO domain-containing protein n=1 Tax=Gongylonema pulchrum TaxID=637853 RepID=A0A183DBW2_9BILA|nr:unnamed protein product [Gongylonema pulchrum]